MTEKQETVVTTVVGAVVVAASTVVSALAPQIAPVFVAICGAANELLNVILHAFVRE